MIDITLVCLLCSDLYCLILSKLSLDPPSPIVELEDSEVDVGSDVWLKCSSKGNPQPKYSWNYYQTTNVLEESEDGVSRLYIHNATAYNMGSYTCHALNERGNVSKTVRVTVKGNGQYNASTTLT